MSHIANFAMLAFIMDSILGIVQSPLFWGIAAFLGVVGVVRVVLMRDPTMKRVYGYDRRKSREPMSSVPFYDSDGVLVSEERRKLKDRRQGKFGSLLDRERVELIEKS